MLKVILGEKYRPDLEEAIIKLGAEAIYIPDNPYVDKRLSGHADLSCFHAGGKILYLSKHIKGTPAEKTMLDWGAELIFPEEEIKRDYPGDALLNVCLVGDNLFCNPKCSCSEALKRLEKCGKNIIYVKQGYCRCSICVVNENSIITADRGIHMAAQKNGLDSLLIEPGYIGLEGFDYGFIGGSTFKTDEQTLAFTGSLENHPSATDIMSFLKRHSVNPIYLTGKKIFDVGSILAFA